jgi:hypothetical protein
MVHVWVCAMETAACDNKIAVAGGTAAVVWDQSPNWLKALDPQHFTIPNVFKTTHVDAEPAETAATLVMTGEAGTV